MDNLSDAPPPQPTHRILIVDDEPEIAFTLKAVLAEAFDDIRVDAATSGREALRRLQQNPYRIIVSDYRMPGMDGMQLLAQAKVEQPSAIRVLLTAFPPNDVAQAKQDAGIDSFLTKPLRRADFIPIITQLLAVRRGPVDDATRPGAVVP